VKFLRQKETLCLKAVLEVPALGKKEERKNAAPYNQEPDLDDIRL